MGAAIKPVPQAVVEIYHAKRGASGASGWMNCPQWEGGGAASVYAARGSVIHEVAAECLTTDADPHGYLGNVYTSDGFEIEFDSDMATIAKTYIDKVREYHSIMGGELLVEQTFDLEYLTGEPGAKSTLDFAVISDREREITIGDLKTGAGVPVDAQGNPQCLIYALLAYDQYSLAYDFDRIRIVIVQPPLNSVSEWVVTIQELEAFRTKVQTASEVYGQQPARPGEKQCRWCSKAADCEAIARDVFTAVEEHDPQEIASDDLADALDKADMVESWVKAIRAEAERRLLDGRAVRGYKLVAGKRGPRKWTSTSEAEALLKGMRVREADMYDRSLISPTSAEKLLKAGTVGERQWTKLQTLISQSNGSPSVAPVFDKRPAIEVTQDAFQPVTSTTSNQE